MQTTMGPAGIVPINAFPGDTQQSTEYPLTISGFLVPTPVTQSYTLTQAPNAPECTVYDYQGQDQEPPTINNPLVGYPGIQPSTDVSKLTPTYVSFYIANGEASAQPVSLPAGPAWGQPMEQQLTPTPFYAFPIKPPLPSLPQQALAYGYTAPQPTNPALSITHETETNLSLPNQITVPFVPTGASQEEEYLQETAINEQQGLGGMLSLGNDGMQPALNSTNTSYHPIPLANVASWLPQATQQIWTPSLIYQNPQTPLNIPSVDGKVVTPQSGAWMTDYNQWLSTCRVAAQWPIIQTTPIGVRSPGQPAAPTVDPQSASNGTVVLNGQLCMGNSFTLKPIPCGTEVGPDVSPSVNKCEEGDWTLPISMTTESIDVNSKENDETGSIE